MAAAAAPPGSTLSYQLTPTCKLVLSKGDITRWQGGAIVNAANEEMLGGRGVDRAIHAAAGPQLKKACTAAPQVRPRVRCPTGQARLTPGFSLPAKFVIHTVGPRYAVGGWPRRLFRLVSKAQEAEAEAEADELLGAAYRSCLQLAKQKGLGSIAFPAVSCGVFQFPTDRAAQVAVRTAREHAGSLREIHWVLFEDRLLQAWQHTAEALLGEGAAASGRQEEGSEEAEAQQEQTATAGKEGTQDSSSGQPLPSVAELLGSTPQLSTFQDALSAANLSSISGEQLTVFAPSSAAFTAALLSGQLWESLAPSASEMRQLLLDHIVTGRRLTLADLQQLAASGGNASDAFSDGSNGTAADGGGEGGALLQMASGRRALVQEQNGSVTVGNASIALPDLEGRDGVVHIMSGLATLLANLNITLQPPAVQSPAAPPVAPAAAPLAPPAAEAVAQVQQAESQPCSDVPTPDGYSCAQQQGWGKCASPPAAPAPPAPPAPPTCTYESNTDLFGGDLPDDLKLGGPERRTADAGACCAKCIARSDCGAWVFGNAAGCPNCCFLKAVSGWSRTPKSGLTAGVVTGRGAAASEPPSPPPSPSPSTPPSPSPSPPAPAPSPSPPPAQPPPPAPSPSPPSPPPAASPSPSPSAPGPSGGGGPSCTYEPGTDLSGGDLPDDRQLSGPQRAVADAGACCAKCLARTDCGAWVFGNAAGCPNCCFLKAASGWSRQPSPSLTAGTVVGRGASPPPSSLSAGPSVTSPTPPPSSSGGGGGSGQQCTILQNNNLGPGTVLATISTSSIGACCQLCQQQAGCNVFVFCPQAAGCDDGAGTIWAGNLCFLKQQPTGSDGQPTLDSYGSGPGVPWTSGYLA
ncbi:O-acetyl-ADP-ribose deacetylase MACROD2 isoform X2 [Chlorella sorokiniana]|uniref:O-acetyl-ADP-ribose deacetylase MACROD2 isoform X2 n=1 Tax=Chlorella sorokiniana TaxID=3076 RepID=A0A2P6TR31_CHLSO|nr:O-acetyl-ADP-ribose deacetylase MACROD2 isoform X2 [Chlorella sorokiniana]|eukprot:PRW56503.1 O-acetyl-ADP-ribose deacetylase MACROD2 isoform X2 [Chlorella sorokiniana]